MWPLRHDHRDEISSRAQPKILTLRAQRALASDGIHSRRERGVQGGRDAATPCSRKSHKGLRVFGQCKHHGQASRPISTRKLRASQLLHIGPINLVVYKGSLGRFSCGRHHLEAGFTLRCFQRLSQPNLATQLCHWRDNWCTRGSSIPVLSY